MKVFRYGLQAPAEHADTVLDQIRKAHAYRNTLTEIERARRTALRSLFASVGDMGALEKAVRDADAAVAESLRTIAARRAKTRSRSEGGDDKAKLTEAKQAKREAVAALAKARSAMYGDAALRDAITRARSGELTGEADVDRYVAAMVAYADVTGGPNSGARRTAKEERINAAAAIQGSGAGGPIRVSACADLINLRASVLRASARAACGLYPGTYLMVEEAFDAAAKMPLYDGAEPNDPRFVRWNGEGAVAIQVQRAAGAEPLRCRDVFGAECTLIQIRKQPFRQTKRAPDPGTTSKRRLHTTFADLRLRVGSDGRAPVWASWPMRMHRPLPDDGEIKRATVHVRRIGPREEWSVEITVANAPQLEACGAGAVAIDLGWRQIGDEIRVAAWLGEDGDSGELRLSARDIGTAQKYEDLRSIRDKKFDLARVWFRACLDAHAGPVPEWLMLALRTMASWKSQARLAAIVGRWKRERFDGDEPIFRALDAWAYNDRHLWVWEAEQRARWIRRRRDIYRCFGARLARQYSTVVFEKFDLSKMARREPPGASEATNERARHNRHLVAAGDLRTIVNGSFHARGGTDVAVSAVDTTRKCAACGNVERFDQAADLRHVCGACGTAWDQDENAAINLLRRHREQLGDAGNTGGARDGEKHSTYGDLPRPSRRNRRSVGSGKAQEKAAARDSRDKIADTHGFLP